MDQTRSIDRTLPIGDQIIKLLEQRFEVPFEVLGGQIQHYKKAALGIVSLTSDYYFHHPEELRPYKED